MPDSVTPLAMITAMSPPLPGPAVVLAICAPPVTARLSAATFTAQPMPPAPCANPVRGPSDRILDVHANPSPQMISSAALGGAPVQEPRFACDSPLEGTGFEPSVPP